MKNCRKNLLKSKNGITLVALVVTIIVLIILAGISISLVLGNNGIITKSKEAKENTIVGQEKEQVELAYISAAVKKLGSNVEEDDLQDELDKTVGNSKTLVSTNGNDLLNVLFKDTQHNYNVNNGKIAFAGIKNDYNNEEIQEMVQFEEGNKIAILNKAGELSYINFEQPDNSQIIEIDISKKTSINTNVKELFSNGSYLTNNGELYILANDGQYYKKADNVKKIYPDKEMAYISNNNELFFFDWSNPVSTNYQKYADNVKEFFGNFSYSMLDGTCKIRLDRDGTFITIEENIRYFHNGYYITSNNDLYKENTSVKGEFNKVADNVKEFNGWDTYLSNNGELFTKKNGTFSKVAENVKLWSGGLYVNSSNELFYNDGDAYNKIAENVKDIGKQGYISLDNKLFMRDEDDNYTDSGYEISKYGIKNSLWFKTADNKIYYYYVYPEPMY